MILEQYYLGCLAHASYLIADEKTGTAAIVDPQRDIDQYLQDAAAKNLIIRYVFLTHFHADFLAGHLELRDRTGAEIRLGAKAEAEYPFTAMDDGESLEFGQVRLQVLETPGHTPEAISLLVYDLDKDKEVPHAVLTGDTLFIGDVGRPDLMASMGVTAEELAADLYESLHRKLLTLPDPTLVYPAHGAGSMCGKNLSTDTVSTIGVQRLHNYALADMSKEDFVRLVTADQPEAPAYFGYDAVLNRQERQTLEKSLDKALQPMSLEEVLRLQKEGAQILDTRDAADYAAAHLRHSINIGLGGKYATWAGSLLARQEPIVIIAEPGREKEAAVRLGRIGFDQVAGFLEGGMLSLDKRPDLVRRVERITASTLAARLADGDTPYLLDVRSEKEWQGKRIEGSVNIPLPHLLERAPEIPRDRKVIIYCGTGYRSSTGASLLEPEGLETVDLVGGFGAWEATDEGRISS